MVSDTRQIPAGGEGTITIKVNTNGYGGHTLKKKILFVSNDPQNSQLGLKIFGRVEKIVTVTPKNVRFGGYAGKPIKSIVRIVPEKKYPFKIVKAIAKIGTYIKFELKEIKKSDRLQYELVIENIKMDKGNYHDQIYLYTDSKLKSRITINVYSKILPNRI